MSKAVINSLLILGGIMIPFGVVVCKTSVFVYEWKFGFGLWLAGVLCSMFALFISLATFKKERRNK